MSALTDLPAEARQACTALAAHTVWPAEEWAIATTTLLKNNLPMDEMGLTRLIQICLAVKKSPSDVARVMVAQYNEALTKSAAPGLQSL